MAHYRAPLRDLKFVYYELFDAAALTALPGLEEATPDLVEAVLEEMGRIAAEVMEPLNAVGDEHGCRLDDGVVTTPPGFRDAYALLRDGGWTALTGRPEYGGQGLPHSISGMVNEIQCAANLSLTMYLSLTHGAYTALDEHATDELKQRFIPQLVDGTWTATMCLTEPQCGTDLGLLTTRAEPAEDGSYRVSGSKIFISAGDHDLAENIVHLVLARLPGGPPGIKGISTLVVPKRRLVDGELVDNGVTCTALEHKMGIKGSATCALQFDGAAGWLVGEPHRGMKALFTMMNAARLHVGVQGLALADAAYQRAAAFARERRQGRALSGARDAGEPADPILVHPDVRRMLLTARAFIEGARALTAWAALEIDHAEHDPDPERATAADDLASLLTPVVKAFQTDLGFEAANLALQVFGGYGYTRDYGVEQIVRDCRITPIYEGTNGIQALDLVGRKLPAHMGRNLRRFFHPVSAWLAEAAGDPEIEELVAPAAKAFDRLQRATAWLAQQGMKDPVEAGAAATDYLHLFGYTALGYLWARMAQVAIAKRRTASGAEAAFYDAKVATARFYVQRMLPRTGALFATVMAGGRSMTEFPDAAF
jgi:alkylation response protein AidB-like acyl-CoA dehydrogenase